MQNHEKSLLFSQLCPRLRFLLYGRSSASHVSGAGHFGRLANLVLASFCNLSVIFG
jgi:hypothetical protein